VIEHPRPDNPQELFGAETLRSTGIHGARFAVSGKNLKEFDTKALIAGKPSVKHPSEKENVGGL